MTMVTSRDSHLIAPVTSATAGTWQRLLDDRAEQLAAQVVSSGETAIEVRSPFDDRRLGAVPVTSERDLDRAVARARAGQRRWADTSIAERAQMIRRFSELVLDRRSELLDWIQLENGKSRPNAYEEIADTALCASYYASIAPSALRRRRRLGAVPLVTSTVELRHPKGVVGIISPWNYPLVLAVTDAIPALLAGNAVVVKPDTQTPFTALLALALLREAGLPSDVAQIVIGDGPVLGPQVVDRVDYVMFTGSTRTGRTVGQRAAGRLVGFSAELGGKNPLLVLADADPEVAGRGAARAAFSNTGQLCISVERVYVDAGVHDRFVAAFVAATTRLRLGPGLDWDVDIGSLATRSQLETVERHVADAVAKGATVLAGGRARPDLGPYFYEPTILTDVPQTALACREETFGPVASVRKVADDAEAVALANDSVYGLNASVWSSDAAHARAVARRLQAGTVNINEGYAAGWGSHSATMGGWKQSGVGRRHGLEGIHKYTEPQTIATQRLVPIAGWPGQDNETYATVVTAAVRALGRLRAQRRRVTWTRRPR
jgi:succinate-semialdehyde dehydrogenase/glutarate-semialdehyde dehydrogenase